MTFGIGKRSPASTSRLFEKKLFENLTNLQDDLERSEEETKNNFISSKTQRENQ